MTTSSVKSLCEELILSLNTDENVLKTITKIIKYYISVIKAF